MRYLAATGLAENTTVVVSADHGQALGEHNLWSMMALTEVRRREVLETLDLSPQMRTLS